jgi:hypothetical protein
MNAATKALMILLPLTPSMVDWYRVMMMTTMVMVMMLPLLLQHDGINVYNDESSDGPYDGMIGLNDRMRCASLSLSFSLSSTPPICSVSHHQPCRLGDCG